MKMLAALLFSFVPAIALAQTSEDAHVQHMGRLADAALNAQYRSTKAAMAQADKAREADIRNGSSKPDGRPTYKRLWSLPSALGLHIATHIVRSLVLLPAAAPTKTKRTASASTR